MLKAEGICKTFTASGRVVQALEDVTVGLNPGERLGLLGPSGSGKSTLAQILSLALGPDRGLVKIDGQKIQGWGLRVPAKQRRKVQLLWQSPRLAVDPRMRLWEIMLEPLAAAGHLPRQASDRKAILQAVQDRMGIGDELLHRFPHEVSDGQLQRACLARALVLEPAYLICDEMSSMLDVSTQASLLQVIADVQAERDMGVLLITHDSILANHWCDRIAVLEAGRLVYSRSINPNAPQRSRVS